HAAHHRDVRTPGEAGRIGAAEKGFDVVRVAADEIALGAILDHAGGDVRAEGGVVGLAIADDVGIGRQLDEDEVLATSAGRRVGDHEGLDVGDLQGCCPQDSARPYEGTRRRAIRLRYRAGRRSDGANASEKAKLLPLSYPSNTFRGCRGRVKDDRAEAADGVGAGALPCRGFMVW